MDFSRFPWEPFIRFWLGSNETTSREYRLSIFRIGPKLTEKSVNIPKKYIQSNIQPRPVWSQLKKHNRNLSFLIITRGYNKLSLSKIPAYTYETKNDIKRRTWQLKKGAIKANPKNAQAMLVFRTKIKITFLKRHRRTRHFYEVLWHGHDRAYFLKLV